ncbi:MAG: hypothetical protein WBP13_04495 [Methylophilaceae bacterium]
MTTACISPVANTNKQQPLPNANKGLILPSIKNNDVNEWLAFAEQYANLTPDAQKLSLSNTNQALSVNPGDVGLRMRLAIIHGLPSSSLQDIPKAQYLLQNLLIENNLNNAQLSFTHILFDYVVASNKASKNSREDEKRQDVILQKNENLQNKLENLQQKFDMNQQKLDVTQQKLVAAQQKINELKNIEKTMGQRDLKK